MNPLPSFSDRAKLDEHVRDALEMSGSKERFSGAVTGYDQVRTTIFITSDERTFLAFVDPKHPVKSGDQVTFRISGQRAVDVRKEIPADS